MNVAAINWCSFLDSMIENKPSFFCTQALASFSNCMNHKITYTRHGFLLLNFIALNDCALSNWNFVTIDKQKVTKTSLCHWQSIERLLIRKSVCKQFHLVRFHQSQPKINSIYTLSNLISGWRIFRSFSRILKAMWFFEILSCIIWPNFDLFTRPQIQEYQPKF